MGGYSDAGVAIFGTVNHAMADAGHSWPDWFGQRRVDRKTWRSWLLCSTALTPIGGA